MRLLSATLRLTAPIFLSALVEWGLFAAIVVGLFLAVPDYPHIAFLVTLAILPTSVAFLAISLIRTGLLVRDKTNAPNLDRMFRNAFLFMRQIGLTVSVVTSLFLMIAAILYFTGNLALENLRMLYYQPVRAFETGVAQSMVTATNVTSLAVFLLISLYIFCCTMMPLAGAAADVANKLTSFDMFWGYGVARNMLFRYCLILLAIGLPVIWYLLRPLTDAFIADHEAIISTLLGHPRQNSLGTVAAAHLVDIGLAGLVFVLMFSIWAAITTLVFIEYRDYVDGLEKIIE